MSRAARVPSLAVCLLSLALGAARDAAAQTVVAIVDTGVDTDHPMLVGKTVSGTDLLDEDSDPDDDVGHGTDLAGVIVGSGPVSGTCTGCLILPIRIAGAAGVGPFLLADPNRVAAGIDYAVAQGAEVILVGVGAIGGRADLLGSVAAAEAAGVPVIAPAGNYQFSHALYPARLDSVLSVLPLDPNGVLAWFASTEFEDAVAAPGENVLTTTMGGATGIASGSSIAAAHVAGLAGALLAANPSLTPAQVRQALRHGANPIPFQPPVERFYEFFEIGAIEPNAVMARSASGFADVAVTRLTFFPNEPLGGQDNFVRVRVVNKGNLATDALSVSGTWNAVPIAPVAIGTLALNEAKEVDLSLPQGAAGQTVMVTASVTTTSGEALLANNSLSDDVSYTSLSIHDVDLVVGEVSEPVLEVGTLSIPVLVRNRGNQSESSVSVEVHVDGALVQSFTVSLALREEESLTALWTMPFESLWRAGIRVSTSTSGDVDPFSNEWFLSVSVGEREEGLAATQYSDVPAKVVAVMDAPWATLRDYVPVLFYLPRFPAEGHTIESFELFNVDPATYTGAVNTRGALIARDSRNNANDSLAGVEILSDVGAQMKAPAPAQGGLAQNTAIPSHFHYVMRIPKGSINPAVGANPATRHLLAVTTTTEPDKNQRVQVVRTRVLRVLFNSPALPSFAAGDRYYDAHVHTIAEQTSSNYMKVNSARKNFGGPIVMLAESAYALGMVGTQVLNGNWAQFRNLLAVTDHNVFYSTGNFDSGSLPGAGPTAGLANGHAAEAAWYRTNLGALAGEELDLTSGSNQTAVDKKLGHHLLVYDAGHFEGPWHGGGFTPSPKWVGPGVANPNTMEAALTRLWTDVLTTVPSRPFGYAAHPNLAGFVWPPEHFERAIGLPPHNSNSGQHIYPYPFGGEFIYKGSQIWNAKAELASSLPNAKLDDLDPFRANSPHRFAAVANWRAELDTTFAAYLAQVASGLIYSFDEDPTQRFIRKLYGVAGTDAHGDFNYTDDIRATAAPGRAVLNSSAFGRVRTYTLLEGRSDPDPVEAYREGNTILTDGPLVKFTFDSDGRHNATGGVENVGRWHDATSLWENPDGRIGGEGDYDGGRTAIAPRLENLFTQHVWKRSANPAAGTAIALDLLIREASESFPFIAALSAGAQNQAVQNGPIDLPIEISLPFVLALQARDTTPGVDESAYTNPIWVIPAAVNLSTTGDCPALTVTAVFEFPVTISGHAGVYIQQLDGNGVSVTDPPIQLEPVGGGVVDPGWTTTGVSHGRWTGRKTVNCQNLGWDADAHAANAKKRAFVVWMNDPREFWDNTLNDFGATITVTVAVQDKDQQKCINELNKNLAKVAKAQGKENSSCVKNGGKGTLPTSIEACLTADAKGKVEKARAKTLAAESTKCIEPPDFGVTDAATVNAAAMQKELELIHEVFGSDLDQTIILASVDSAAANCQASLTKDIQKCQDTKLKEFGKCKKDGLAGKSVPPGAGSPFATFADLETCLGFDPKLKIAKKCHAVSGKLRGTIGKKCGGVDLSTAVPGCNSDDPLQLAQCLDERIECAACKALNTADALSADCDLVDDAASNGSCPP